MRKYLTAPGSAVMHGHVCWNGGGRTVVDLLECDDRICRQIVLRVLVEQEGLGGDGALLLLGRRHGGVLVARIHGGGGGEAGRECTAGAKGGSSRAGRAVFTAVGRTRSIPNGVLSRGAPVWNDGRAVLRPGRTQPGTMVEPRGRAGGWNRSVSEKGGSERRQICMQRGRLAGGGQKVKQKGGMRYEIWRGRRSDVRGRRARCVATRRDSLRAGRARRW